MVCRRFENQVTYSIKSPFLRLGLWWWCCLVLVIFFLIRVALGARLPTQGKAQQDLPEGGHLVAHGALRAGYYTKLRKQSTRR
jgi:hypothetical protein